MDLPAELALESRQLLSRRWFLQQCGVGVGAMMLGSLLRGERALGMSAGGNPMAAKTPHFAPKAKRVIFLFQAGAPSQLDLFDPKPELTKWDGKPVPAELVKGQQYAFIKPDAALFASRFKFDKHGQSGADVSELFPELAKVVDDIAIVKSMTTDAINHAPAQIFMNTGSQQFGRPSLGAWTTYGLGSASEDLPGFVVMSSAGGLSGGAGNYGCGFLPTTYSGVPFRKSGDPILSLSNPPGVDAAMQRRSLDALKQLNQFHLEQMGDPEIATRIAATRWRFGCRPARPS
jgi:hypothetical protein